jgi:CHAT domain-containing protein
LGPFVGVGDPIYNTADSRWQDRTTSSLFSRWFSQKPLRPAEPSLARLPGSGREIQACSRSWSSSEAPTLLSGAAITRVRLEEVLSSHPAVLHLATHVLQPMAQRELAIIAIGLDARGQPDFLTPDEIAAHVYRPGLVVLTGCSSGQGKALPGVGLFGITRAWLLSGAQAVVASHWPTPDESGELFQQFYRAYPAGLNQISSAGAATALRSAQIAMLHAGSWQARPSYWAGFYVTGKD